MGRPISERCIGGEVPSSAVVDRAIALVIGAVAADLTRRRPHVLDQFGEIVGAEDVDDGDHHAITARCLPRLRCIDVGVAPESQMVPALTFRVELPLGEPVGVGRLPIGRGEQEVLDRIHDTGDRRDLFDGLVRGHRDHGAGQVLDRLHSRHRLEVGDHIPLGHTVREGGGTAEARLDERVRKLFIERSNVLGCQAGSLTASSRSYAVCRRLQPLRIRPENDVRPDRA